MKSKSLLLRLSDSLLQSWRVSWFWLLLPCFLHWLLVVLMVLKKRSLLKRKGNEVQTQSVLPLGLRWKVGPQKHYNAPFNLCLKVFIRVKRNMINLFSLCWDNCSYMFPTILVAVRLHKWLCSHKISMELKNSHSL